MAKTTKAKATSKTLEQEAKEFVQKKTPKEISSGDKVALRFYMGNALAGLIARSPTGRPDEIIREAYEYARKCLEYEENF